VPTRSKFQNVHFAYIKQSNSRDVSEGLDDAIVLIIDDAGSSALDTMAVSHFSFASSHSLRGIYLFEFLKKQNSLLGLLVTLNFIFNHQRKFRNFLNTMTFLDMTRAGKAKAARAEQMAYHFWVVFTLRCQLRQVLVGPNMHPPQHIFPKVLWSEQLSHHLKLWEFKLQLCQYPKTQHWSGDLLIH
jgi:hypothetical protein